MDIFPLLVTDDEDLLLISLQTTSPRKRIYYNQSKLTTPFNFDALDDDYCWLHFRFLKADLIRLKAVLGIPDILKCAKYVTVGGMEALCVVLKRLSYPNRYNDLMNVFPRTRCELSRICSQMIGLIRRKHGQKLRSLNQAWLTLNEVKQFAHALVAKGSPYKECFGFIDGTVRPVCRPSRNQKQYYNGHRRVHAIKFQSVTVPNGLILHMSQPVVGRRHDGYLLQCSGLLAQLENRFSTPCGRPYHLYGDPAYPLSPNLITPFKSHTLNPAKKICNKRMSSIRESVEWGFGKIISLFAFLDYKKKLKICKQPVEYYTVGALLANCHTCIYGSQTGMYFECQPPTLEEYMA